MAKLPMRLKELRKQKDLKQEKLASHLNLSRSTIAGYETGKRKPDYNTLEKIASFFNVSVDYLLGRTEERKTADKIKKALADDPELVELWEELAKREDLKLLFKQVKSLDTEAIERIREVAKIIENKG
ncbi:helix-turn-helix domain-containing protein [Fuchsiella alkaliacetigena]|uniref:helix-turn-helix domain-containing protein n=1 Tax=Fuchsiella alkaliacetigena TaxID=957042 RepID=UPI00200B0B35|nr:helix-turn-helix transcriptional regulator [Fuchsiella alkaliacetigena]MCK8824344.1 helix-turn-helix domain-containing protein [Fuchsiella alkaliacetigena]